ncbi:serine/threonine-protein kinase [Pseudofulvimonas gallinarii]|jgi:serine/threonine protein kinase/tetratricopeptide (TPR) repeat protein|uniref:Serine/threonine-protein kinase n=2 Tax=Pseudofulvimonas gallinarii TaxID=634155 RepID=A0A4R3LHI7_9GAMM|nr:serine/threonine-protein kinase [Pseudofulvimonas gallinarii]TCS99609.1 serine/threonine-protein kinase [Pseudofulvimonas gallinarii]THD14821.1 hypothetical protein B1808_02025 [Pseudofulvimonas gallinarii]
MDLDDPRLLKLVRAALERQPGDRGDFVSAQCAGDAALLSAAEALLRDAEAIESGTATWVHGDDDRPRGAATDAMLGQRLGPFRIRERIGRGGMGVVYRGEREEGGFAQTVAIKLIRRGFDYDDVQQRFLRERRILARLSHPNLARLVDGGVTADQRPWFAMELVQGESIRSWCDQRRLDVRARVRLFLDVCAAVQYAHTQLVVHRDLKPGNVMVDEQGVVRLLDFGISRLLHDEAEAELTMTAAGPLMAFTPEYAAPEQLAGEPAGVAADVYALGVILYELVSGALPHDVDRHDLLAAQHRMRTRPVPSLGTAILRGADAGGGDEDETVTQRLARRGQAMRSYLSAVRGDLNRILGKALAVEVPQRYATVDAFADDLRRWLAGAPVKVSGRGWAYRLRKFVTRNAVAVSLVVALLVGLLVSLAWALERAYSERQQRELAQTELKRSNAVRDYIALMFRVAADREGEGDVSAREILSRSSARLFSQFRNDTGTGYTTALMVAELYLAMGDTEGARPLLERILSASGPQADADTLARANALQGQLEYRRGQPDRALEHLDHAQAIWRRAPARNALAINDSQGMRAQILRGMGQLNEALAIQQAVIEERHRLLPTPDEALADAYNNLAITLMAAFRFDQAGEASDRALAIQQALDIGQSGSSNAIALLGTRASILTAQGRHAEAESTYRELIGLRDQLYGEASLDSALLLGSLGTSILYQQRYEEAAETLHRAVTMASGQGGGDNPSILTLRIALAGSYARMGRGDDALAVLASVQERLDAQGGNPSLQAMLHAGRARALLALRRLPHARAALADAEASYAAMGVSGDQFNAWLKPLRTDIEEAGQRR